MRSRRSLLAALGTGTALASAGVVSADDVDLRSIRDAVLDGSTTAGPDGSTAATDETTPTAVAPDPGDWPGHQFDAGNSGTNTAGTAIGGDPQKVWSVDTGPAKRGRSTDPRVVDGVVYDAYSGTDTYAVRAHDAATGDRLWRSPLDGAATGLAVADGLVHLTTPETLHKFDAATGERLDTRDLDGEGNESPTVVGETVYLGLSTDLEEKEGVLMPYLDGAFVAIDVETYERQWRYDSRRTNRITTPTYADGAVYTVSSEHGVVELDAADGTKRRTFGPPAQGEAPVVRDGTLITSSVDRLAAFDLDSGDRRWRVGEDYGETNYRYYGPPVCDGERVYAWRNTVLDEKPAAVVALDAADGSVAWTFRVEPKCGTTGWKTGFARVGDELVVLDEEARFYGLDPAEGTERWRYDPFESATNRKFDDFAVAGGTIYGELDVWDGSSELWAIRSMTD
ncbi:PQQ-binding-like beta-propeller repeat protein [Halobacteriales archaeon Cl-PHB]